jgi:uncharacterized OB-fold protein
MPGRSAPSALSQNLPIGERYVTVPGSTRTHGIPGPAKRDFRDQRTTFGTMSSTVPVHQGLFTDGDALHLVGGRCNVCGHHNFPHHEVCPYCASDDTAEVELSSVGRLWAWTAVTHAPPGYTGEIPYGFGVVELPEGLRVVTRLTESDPGRLRADQPVHLVLDHLHTDDEGRSVVTYAFAVDETTSS